MLRNTMTGSWRGKLDPIIHKISKICSQQICILLWHVSSHGTLLKQLMIHIMEEYLILISLQMGKNFNVKCRHTCKIMQYNTIYSQITSTLWLQYTYFSGTAFDFSKMNLPNLRVSQLRTCTFSVANRCHVFIHFTLNIYIFSNYKHNSLFFNLFLLTMSIVYILLLFT